MIDTIIHLLQKLKTIRFHGLSYVRITCVSLLFSFIGGAFLFEILIDLESFFEETTFQRVGGCIVVLGIVLLILLIVFSLRDIFRLFFRGFEFKNLIEKSFTVYFPISFILSLVVPFITEDERWGEMFERTQSILLPGSANFQRYELLPLLFVLAYPLLSLLSSQEYLSGFQKFFKQYNLGFFFVVSLLVSIEIFFLGGNANMWEIIIGVFFAIIPLIVTRQHLKGMESRLLSLILGVSYLIISYIVFGYLPNSLDIVYKNQLSKVGTIFQKEGETYDGYNKAGGLRFLEKAFLDMFNRQKNTNNPTFEKLFDSSPESFYGEKLVGISSNTSRGTNATKVGDQAKVEFGVVSIEHRIVNSGSAVAMMMTVYDIYFQNTLLENQEVIMNFEAPSDLSVVSNLKLGLDLQYQGQVASRGAARKVYEDSLRINKDPALIEKVGISTYNLRVFPIPSKGDVMTQGRQRVQITMTTPVSASSSIVYAPRFSLVNLKVAETSSFISKVYVDKALLKEEIKKGEEITTFMDATHVLEKNIVSKMSANMLSQSCIPQHLNNGFANIDVSEIKNLLSGYQEGLVNEKIYVFMDNSRSVERNEANKQYADIYSSLKNYNGSLQDVELYSFNFRVDPLTSVEDMKYRGYSDVDSVLTFIEKNNIENSRIVIVTDDDSYNFSTRENMQRNLGKIISNQFNVIKVGKDIKKYKSDFISVLSATQGNIYTIDNKDSLTSTLQSIFGESRLLIPFCSGSDTKDVLQSPITNKIYAGYLASRLMRVVGNAQDRMTIAELQGKLAESFGIVTQFNSMIALENEQQQRDLERYEQQGDKFASDFNNTTKGGRSNAGGIDWSATQGGRDNERLRELFNGSSRSVSVQPESLMDRIDTTSTSNSRKSIAGSSRSAGVFGAPIDSSYSRSYSLFGGSRVNIFGSLLILCAYLLQLYHLYLLIMAIVKGEQDDDATKIIINSDNRLDESRSIDGKSY